MKNKILSFVCAIMMVFSTMFTLAACSTGENDEHNFTSDVYYEVIDNKAYTYKCCKCGEKSDFVEMPQNSYIIATPSTAQSIIDGNINGKTIIFDDGEYNNILDLRPSAGTVKIYRYDDEQIEENELDVSELGRTQIDVYKYVRNFENIIFAGTKDAIFKNTITINAGSIFQTETGNCGKFPLYDAVRNMDYTNPEEYGRHYSNTSLNNVVFTRMNFDGVDARIHVYYTAYTPESEEYNIKNFTVSHCNFYADGYVDNTAAVKLDSGFNGSFENIILKDNYIDGHFQGLATLNVKNLDIVNNTILHTKHNSITVQSATLSDGTALNFEGVINVKNNKITDALNQAIKFNKGMNATITVENNVMSNNVWANKHYVMQLGDLTNSSYTLKNNIYNGVKMEDEIKPVGDYSWKFIYEPGYIVQS